jgi:hypothetical protein
MGENEKKEKKPKKYFGIIPTTGQPNCQQCYPIKTPKSHCPVLTRFCSLLEDRELSNTNGNQLQNSRISELEKSLKVILCKPLFQHKHIPHFHGRSNRQSQHRDDGTGWKFRSGFYAWICQ